MRHGDTDQGPQLARCVPLCRDQWWLTRQWKGDDENVDSCIRRQEEARLARLQLLLAAQERKAEVVDVVWSAKDEEDAAGRIRDLLGIEDDADPRVVLDMQVRRLTEEAREEIAAEVEQLRVALGTAG